MADTPIRDHGGERFFKKSDIDRCIVDSQPDGMLPGVFIQPLAVARPVPRELERLVLNDPVVAAFVRSYRAGQGSLDEMWRGIALAQSEAKAQALGTAKDVIERFGIHTVLAKAR